MRKINQCLGNLFITTLLFFSYDSFSSPCHSNGFEMMFPLEYHRHDIGDVLVTSDGINLCAISSRSLYGVIAELLTEDLKHWLASYPDSAISAEVLASMGIQLSFDLTTLTLTLVLDEGRDRIYNLNNTGAYQTLETTDSSKLSMISSFNFEYSYQEKSTDTATLQWLAGTNIGGSSGLNIETNISLTNSSYEDPESHDWSLIRGPMLMYHDQYRKPTRYSFGDISTPFMGHLPNLEIGGISVDRNYSELQPDRNIQNTSMQYFQLRESAEVEVYVNDIYVSRYRLEPGRYNIDNLPLSSGSNDIRLEVQYLSGWHETLYYSKYYNATLLSKGLSDFNLSVGSVSDYNFRDISYSDEYIASGFYNYGISDELTMGLNGLYSQSGFLTGTTITNVNLLGNFAVRFTYGCYQWDNNDCGYIGSVDYEQSVIGSGISSAANLRLGYEYLDSFTSTPWVQSDLYQGHSAYADYTAYLTDNFDISIGMRSDKIDEDTSLQTYTSSANYNLYRNRSRYTFGVRGEYQPSKAGRDEEWTINANLSWNWSSSSLRYSSSVNYDTNENRSSADFTRSGPAGIDSFGYRLSAEYDDNIDRQSVSADYIANRWRSSTSISRTSFTNGKAELDAFVYLNTSVGFVDGTWGVGVAPVGPFSIVKTHTTLEEFDLEVNGYENEKPAAIATSLMPSLVGLTSPYMKNTISVNIPDVPIGLDYGEGSYLIVPGSLTGHKVIVGSDNNYTVIGRLVDEIGEPVALKSIQVVFNHEKISSFTNRNGRFVLEGVLPGEYKVIVKGERYNHGMFSFGEDKNYLINIGTISLLATETPPESVRRKSYPLGIISIEKGDTIWSLTRALVRDAKITYGIDLDDKTEQKIEKRIADNIIDANNLADGNLIFPNQKLYLPDIKDFI